MKFFLRSISLFMAVTIVSGMFVTLKPYTKAKATLSVETPTFTLKRVNSGTGVKIIINKTKGATGYNIYMTNRENAYSSYLKNGGKYKEAITEIKKNGKAKRTYTINGLPKGTYAFQVQAYAEEMVYVEEDRASYLYHLDSGYSSEKSIYIKAAKKKTTTEKTYDFSKTKVGDTIKFGLYEQDDDMTNGKEEIEWIVFAKDNKKILVVSKYALDCLPYNKRLASVTWENCSLKDWLNNKFYTTAFTEKERAMIKEVNLTNNDNPYGAEGGNDTKDKIFLLSLDDIVNKAYGFNSDCYEWDIARRCAPTAYAVAQGTYLLTSIESSDNCTSEGKNACWWWLRSPGEKAYDALDVRHDGGVYHTGIPVDSRIQAVRPALYLKLK